MVWPSDGPGQRPGRSPNQAPNGSKPLLDLLVKILLAIVSAAAIFVFGRFSTLQDNERVTYGNTRYEQGVEIGRQLGVDAERKRWLDKSWRDGGGHIHPERPAYRDPQGSGPGEGYPGEGSAR